MEDNYENYEEETREEAKGLKDRVKVTVKFVVDKASSNYLISGESIMLAVSAGLIAIGKLAFDNSKLEEENKRLRRVVTDGIYATGSLTGRIHELRRLNAKDTQKDQE